MASGWAGGVAVQSMGWWELGEFIGRAWCLHEAIVCWWDVSRCEQVVLFYASWSMAELLPEHLCRR